jgi:hypothetical protein
MPPTRHAAGLAASDARRGTQACTHSTDKDIARDREQYDWLPSVRMPGHDGMINHGQGAVRQVPCLARLISAKVGTGSVASETGQRRSLVWGPDK